MDELPIPEELLGDADAIELARVWVGQGDLHVTLNIGMYDADEGPGELVAWGDILADMIRHVAHAVAQQSGADEAQAREALLARIGESLADDDRPPVGGFEADA